MAAVPVVAAVLLQLLLLLLLLTRCRVLVNEATRMAARALWVQMAQECTVYSVSHNHRQQSMRHLEAALLQPQQPPQ